MRCQWSYEGVRCSGAAGYIIVSGCLDGHLHERVYCYEHCGHWALMFEDQEIPCFHPGCTLKGTDWDYTKVENIRGKVNIT